jgi:hypothetical protein
MNPTIPPRIPIKSVGHLEGCSAGRTGWAELFGGAIVDIIWEELDGMLFEAEHEVM